MLAIAAPATPPTNRRRDIVIGSSPDATKEYRLIFIFRYWKIYPTEVTNDQVITMATEKPCRVSADICPMFC